MSTLIDDVRYLSETIGPRGTGTSSEAAAAEFVGKRLNEYGYKPEIHVFKTVPSQNAFPIAISVLTLIAAAVFPLGVVVSNWLAVILSIGAGWSLWQTIRNDPINPLTMALSKVPSQNVEVCVNPKGKVENRVVILAHLDSNRCRLVWQSLSVKSLGPMTWLTLAVPIGMGLLYLCGTITRNLLWWWISLPFVAYEIGAIITLIRDDRTPFSPGAHDNAASIAVAIEVAKRISNNPLNNTETWFVFDGAEETDHGGTIDFLRRHGGGLREAVFIGLEGLGSGEIVYLTRQGVCAYYRPHPSLLKLTQMVSADHPELDFRPAQMIAEDDVRTLSVRGYRAICFAGRDPETGILPRWHRIDDTYDSVSERTMLRASEILHAVLKEIDS